MANMSAIQALKKAHEAMAIIKSDYSMQDFVAKFKNPTTQIARMAMVAIKSKYVEKFDNRHKEDGGSLGYRTEFTVTDPEGKGGTKTIATFSNAAHDFYRLYAMFKGWDPESKAPVPQVIEIIGSVMVEVQVLQLDAKKSTYNFRIVEEESTLTALGGYVPDTTILLGSGDSYVDIESGEITDTAPVEVEPPTEKKRTAK